MSGINNTVYLFACLILLFSSASAGHSLENDPSLEFQVSGNPVNKLSLSFMKSKLQVHEIELFHPNYGKNKKYEGFSVSDVLGLGFGDKLNNPDYPDVAFIALDGYESVSDKSKLNEPGGYIVFKDLDHQGWEPIDDKQANPGPFYLLWTGKEQTTANEYPWPYQLVDINLVSFKDAYPLVYPKGAEAGSGAYKGYEIFRGRCFRCHAMNRQGGKIGPDLNAPKSIVTYRSEFMIKELTKHPSKYRYGQMPDHPDLTDTDLGNLIKYFIYMDQNRN